MAKTKGKVSDQRLTELFNEERARQIAEVGVDTGYHKVMVEGETHIEVDMDAVMDLMVETTGEGNTSSPRVRTFGIRPELLKRRTERE